MGFSADTFVTSSDVLTLDDFHTGDGRVERGGQAQDPEHSMHGGIIGPFQVWETKRTQERLFYKAYRQTGVGAILVRLPNGSK